MTRACVLGSGSWGTAFSMVLVDAGTEVTMWGRREDLCVAITATHANPDYLPGIALPGALRATSDAARALDGADVVVLALPSQTLRANLVAWAPLLPPDCLLVSLMKGIELRSAKRMSEVLIEVTGAAPERVAVVSGPNLAREIAERQPAAAVVACADEAGALELQVACHSTFFRPYTTTDVVGCELGGAVKNVIALAVGMAQGMGFGDNARASLITRGLAETARLGVALGADPQTFAGLAGLGDLVATCSSPLSRNRTVGERLGRGMSVEDVLAATRQTAEGVQSCGSIHQLGIAAGVDMPLTAAVVGVVHDGRPPADVVRSLMSRAAKAERPPT